MAKIEIAQKNKILHGVVGSKAYGTSLDENNSDRDEVLVFIEPREYITGLGTIETVVYRDAKDGEKSKAGDLDLTCYGLQKFCRLALKGNPNILEALFLKEYLFQNTFGKRLMDQTEIFHSKEAGNAYLGYMTSQKHKLLGLKNKGITRQDDNCDFDTKFAAHALRLGYQGHEFLSTGRLILPIEEPKRQNILDIRLGKWTLEDVLNSIDEQEEKIKAAMHLAPLQPNVCQINKFLHETYVAAWEQEEKGK